MFVQFGLLSLLVIKQTGFALCAHPILLITRNDNRPNWTPLSSITITYHVVVAFYIKKSPRFAVFSVYIVIFNSIPFFDLAEHLQCRPQMRNHSTEAVFFLTSSLT